MLTTLSRSLASNRKVSLKGMKGHRRAKDWEGEQEGDGVLSWVQTGDLASGAGGQLSLSQRAGCRDVEMDIFWEEGSKGEGSASEARHGGVVLGNPRKSKRAGPGSQSVAGGKSGLQVRRGCWVSRCRCSARWGRSGLGGAAWSVCLAGAALRSEEPVESAPSPGSGQGSVLMRPVQLRAEKVAGFRHPGPLAEAERSGEGCGHCVGTR